jgi:hypothetical protein
MKHVLNWYGKPDEPQAGALHEAVVTVLLENGRLTVDQVHRPSQQILPTFRNAFCCQEPMHDSR